MAGVGEVEVDNLAQEPVGHLQQHARAVPGGRVGTRCATVVEVLQGGQALGDDVVIGDAAQLRDEGDATGVVLEGRVVQALTGAGRHRVQRHLITPIYANARGGCKPVGLHADAARFGA